MSQNLPNLSLPLLQASQAQKHVTHNEALYILDTVTQLSVLSSNLSSPPEAEDGDRYLVPAGAAGDWTDQDGAVAVFDENTWRFLSPKTGWVAFDQSVAEFLLFDGANWGELPKADTFVNLQSVGVNATADATNRLSISAPAILLSHEGGGHQVKVNKASEGDTASLLFQSNWSGHAEMGLNGSNNWSLKVSADGANWQDALSFDPATAAVSGASVQSNATDNTPGRLMRADYGYGPGNVLGIVSEVAGVPSGSVIETGTGGEGVYTRFADGTLICTSAPITTDVNTVIGALLKSTTQLWTYPSSFVSAPVVSAGGVDDVSNIWVTAGQADELKCSAVAFGHTSAISTTFSLTAIGRWF
ncbi:MAG: DUF2793 domain-containing protein [Lentilitoribacter sp.]